MPDDKTQRAPEQRAQSQQPESTEPIAGADAARQAHDQAGIRLSQEATALDRSTQRRTRDSASPTENRPDPRRGELAEGTTGHGPQPEHTAFRNEMRSQITYDLTRSLWDIDSKLPMNEWLAATTVAQRVETLCKKPEYQGPDGLRNLKGALETAASKSPPAEARSYAAVIAKVDTARAAMENSDQALKTGDIHGALRQYVDHRPDITESGTEAREDAETVRQFLKEQLDRPDFPANRWGYHTLSLMCDMKALAEQRSDSDHWNRADDYEQMRDHLQHLADLMPEQRGQRPGDTPLATRIKADHSAAADVLPLVDEAEKDAGFDRSPGSYHLLSKLIETEANAENAGAPGDPQRSVRLSRLAKGVAAYAENPEAQSPSPPAPEVIREAHPTESRFDRVVIPDQPKGPFAESMKAMRAYVADHIVEQLRTHDEELALNGHFDEAGTAARVRERVRELLWEPRFSGPEGLRNLNQELKTEAERSGPVGAGEYKLAMEKVATAATTLEDAERIRKSGDAKGAAKQFLDYEVQRHPANSDGRASAAYTRDYLNGLLDQPGFPNNRWGYETLAKICYLRSDSDYADKQYGRGDAYLAAAGEFARLTRGMPKPEGTQARTDAPLSDSLQLESGKPSWRQNRENAKGVQQAIELVREAERNPDFDRSAGSYRLLSHLIDNTGDYEQTLFAGQVDKRKALYAVVGDVIAYADELPSSQSAVTAITENSANSPEVPVAKDALEHAEPPVLDRGASRTGGRQFVDTPAQLASGTGNISTSKGGHFEITAGSTQAHGIEVPEVFDSMLRRIIHESDAPPDRKEAALAALELVKDPANKEALDVVIKASKEAGRLQGLKGAEGSAVGTSLVVLTLASWYTMYKTNRTQDAYIPGAPVN